jgi:eukaryotic-like serine/threonine-protein kinase
MIGSKLGQYTIREQIGAGGMGVVYRARDERLERDVALKVLPVGRVTEEGARRLRKEALSLSRLNHPNIETVFDFNSQEGVDFLVAELIPGTTLSDKLAAGPLPEKEIVRLGAQLAEGLEAAHGSGLVHRDLKPGNLRITPDGRLKILDFGLAKEFGRASGVENGATQDVTVGIIGTVAYMAPEQLHGEAADVRSDIYSAGAVLYEMATSRQPFEEKTSPLLIASVLNRSPAAPSVVNRRISPALERVILKAMDKHPDRRYQSARELLVDLRRLESASGEVVAQEKSRPAWVWAVVASVVVIALLAVLVYRNRVRPARATATERITLAVLPFDLLTSETDIGFLRVGIPDAIISKLSSVGRLRLRPTSTILPYEKRGVDAREAGHALATDYVATGTVQETGGRFRVTAQLVRVTDGSPVWGDHYDVPRSDLLLLEDAMADRLASALEIQISNAERERLYRRYTSNPEAYENYLKGRAELARYTRQSTAAALTAFESALHVDPDYPLAHAGLAMACAVMRIRFAPEDEVSKWDERARSEAQRAITLDPNLAEAHEALAAVSRSSEFNWELVINESRRALELNPSLEMPHYYIAVAYYHLGLLDDVEKEVRAGLEINPINRAEALRVRGAAALFGGQFRESERFLNELRQVSGSQVSDWYLSMALYYEGDAAPAELLLSNLHGSAQAERRAQATLASFLAARHERKLAEALLKTVTSSSYIDHHVAYSTGATYAQLGQLEEARRWLSRAVDSGFPCYPWFEQDPLLRPMSDDPEFRAFMVKLRRSWENAKSRYAIS